VWKVENDSVKTGIAKVVRKLRRVNTKENFVSVA
jgi:hypothetical protein